MLKFFLFLVVTRASLTTVTEKKGDDAMAIVEACGINVHTDETTENTVRRVHGPIEKACLDDYIKLDTAMKRTQCCDVIRDFISLSRAPRSDDSLNIKFRKLMARFEELDFSNRQRHKP